jgi:CheY-like chemotaxis protein
MPKTILVADDEEIIRNYVSRALSGRGYAVKTAADGAAAIEMARQENFDLLICDLKMPGLRGEKVVKAILALRPATRVIVITGSVSEISETIVPGLKVEGFLVKPFGIDEIRDLAEKTLA